MLIDTRIIEGFEIKFYAEDEYQFASECFEQDEADEIQAKIDSGDLEWFCAKVTASKNGIELADTYLGACCYKTFEDFINLDWYYGDMVNTVIEQAKQVIIDLSK